MREGTGKLRTPACVPGAEVQRTEKDIIVQNVLTNKKFIQEKIEHFGEKWGYARNVGKISCLEMKRCARNAEHIGRNIEPLTQYRQSKKNAIKRDSEGFIPRAKKYRYLHQMRQEKGNARENKMRDLSGKGRRTEAHEDFEEWKRKGISKRKSPVLHLRITD